MITMSSPDPWKEEILVERGWFPLEGDKWGHEAFEDQEFTLEEAYELCSNGGL